MKNIRIHFFIISCIILFIKNSFSWQVEDYVYGPIQEPTNRIGRLFLAQLKIGNIPISISEIGLRDVPIGDLETETQHAVDEWTNRTGFFNFTVSVGNQGTNMDDGIFFVYISRDGKVDGQDYFNPGDVAYADFWRLDSRNGEIVDATIFLYDKESEISWSTTQMDMDNKIADCRSVMTHEIGHILLYCHSNINEGDPGYDPTYCLNNDVLPTMVDGLYNPSHGKTTHMRTLEDDDIAAVNFLYSEFYVPDVYGNLHHALPNNLNDQDIIIVDPPYQWGGAFYSEYKHETNLETDKNIVIKFMSNSVFKANSRHMNLTNGSILIYDQNSFLDNIPYDYYNFIIERPDYTIRAIYPRLDEVLDAAGPNEKIYKLPLKYVFTDVTGDVGILQDKFRSVTAVFGNFENERFIYPDPLDPTKKVINPEHKKAKHLFVCNAGYAIEEYTYDANSQNRLYYNDGINFEEKSMDLTTSGVFDEEEHYSSSQALIFDYDEDGYDDLFVCTVRDLWDPYKSPNKLYYNWDFSRYSNPHYHTIVT